ncbi:UDP-N-acetylmuramoylalanyl-D-glutamyl-2,6-diaminopimelate--D-alanyl-D-alanine ligase [Richelia intracellularis HH01]|uniref:UDP-N-acetylmuramoyl-tripeptide--D-alanyl-D-alanine ligase n=1 Tax=Richelia intracellularis HH01 TaxID=1165094 RepID=M1X2F4_9NOST|nr:UDP-N-acetylmuramoyl-tripeptide--D-alanyl-D-alanine ligase [Richelia intracellularis]CCH66730.1 UDP-N-acetylmuramoylalanyl-D-glutamyl-2,6-diaminopimelate--D-alanyl-D-alanine ligase [Richelia intracellularis HH01]HAE05337.1 UDP-N-acetylmuramoyl-tripeptide--D-alanyl-D-alanine ligase [Richelia sp.]
MPCFATLNQLVNIIGAKAINLSIEALVQIINGVQTDTRIIKQGEVFVALRGEKFDGHKFISIAVRNGAIAAIADFEYQDEGFPILQVRSTLAAYQQIARWWRDHFNIPVIGITGSVGKTTTKELIAGVLATKGKVHKTYANFNNEVGVPKTLLELDAQYDYSVIEMAMRGAGQIAELTDIVSPTIGVITNVGKAHIDLLGSEAAIASAKCELLAQMSQDSVAILNYDNPLLIEVASQLWHGRVITFGFTGGDIRGKLIDLQTLDIEGMKFNLPMPGRHIASNYMAALAIAKIIDIDWITLQTGIMVDIPGGRSRRFTLPNKIVILDETYNAAPEAMIAALNLLSQTPGKRRIAVLGAMRELGKQSQQLHQKIGETVRELQLDGLVVLMDGEDTEAIVEKAVGVPSQCFNSHEELLAGLKKYIKSGDQILFKASHSVGLEEVVIQLRDDLCLSTTS